MSQGNIQNKGSLGEPTVEDKSEKEGVESQLNPVQEAVESVSSEELGPEGMKESSNEVIDKEKTSVTVRPSTPGSHEVEDVSQKRDEGLGSLGSRDALFQAIAKNMKLVEDKKNHAHMLQDATITGFLLLCMGDDDPQVVERSFEVFHAMSKFPENIPELKKINYFTNALRVVARNISLRSIVRCNAKNLIAELKSFSKESQSHALSELSDSMKNMMSVTDSGPTTSAISKDENWNPNAKPADLNTTMSTLKRKNKGRETIFFVDNNVLQQKSDRAKVTQALIKVPGIISVTYDLKKNYCIVRGKRSTAQEDFGRSVASLGIANVYLVRKNENKEEVMTLIQANEKENIQLPPYPEELEPEEADNSAAVARTDKNPDNNPSFLNSAKNFIKRSFYW